MLHRERRCASARTMRGSNANVTSSAAWRSPPRGQVDEGGEQGTGHGPVTVGQPGTDLAWADRQHGIGVGPSSPRRVGGAPRRSSGVPAGRWWWQGSPLPPSTSAVGCPVVYGFGYGIVRATNLRRAGADVSHRPTSAVGCPRRVRHRVRHRAGENVCRPAVAVPFRRGPVPLEGMRDVRDTAPSTGSTVQGLSAGERLMLAGSIAVIGVVWTVFAGAWLAAWLTGERLERRRPPDGGGDVAAARRLVGPGAGLAAAGRGDAARAVGVLAGDGGGRGAAGGGRVVAAAPSPAPSPGRARCAGAARRVAPTPGWRPSPIWRRCWSTGRCRAG